MKYLLLCALLICGAFFSSYVTAQQNKCPDGGTFQNHPDLGQICSTPAPYGTIWEANYAGSIAQGTTEQQARERACILFGDNYAYSPGSPPSSSPEYNGGTLLVGVECRLTVRWVTRSASDNYQTPTERQATIRGNGFANLLPPAHYCPPDESPKLTAYYEAGDAKICWAPAFSEPCDCSELAGSGTLPYTSFTAKKGVYSAANPPQCNTVTDPDTGQQCHCQLIAQKWLETGSGENSTWSPLPYDRDKPSGTYTGAACGDEDADTAPPEKEECFTLKSGQKWCFSNPDEKCTVVNGQQQCSSGCGYINGDFVCYEENDPVIPDRPNDDMKPIDDTITDPNKTMPDINKGDLKEIQKGSEQRLDNVIIGVNNNTNELQNIGDKIGQTNKKLDGIGQQLDGQGKTLKGIADGIEDAFGDDGAPDGGCEGDCTGSWYESAYPDGIVGIWQEHSEAFNNTPAVQFLDQFKFSPVGTQPDWSVCVNLGPLGDYGCHSLNIPAFVWVFIRICILITAAFLCRAIIFGG